MVRSKKWCYSHLTAFSSDFVAHDDEPYTIGSSSVRYHLFLPAWLLFTIILAKFAIYNVFLQVDVYDFVKKRGMFVATQRTEVRFQIKI